MSWWRASRPDALRAAAAAGLVLALPLLAVALATGLAFPAQTDEARFHFDTIRAFGEAFPQAPWREYHAATTPLPYVLWGVWGRLCGFEWPALRLLTLLLSYAGLLLFYRLARRRGHAWPLAESLLLLFSPYVFLNAFTAYTVNMGMAFGVLALGLYLEAGRRDWKRLLGASVAATAAVYCRQHYVFLPAGMAMWWAIQSARDRRIGWLDLRDLALISLPGLAVAPLFVAWGGLTPPAFQGLHPLAMRPEHVNFLLMLVGGYFAPVALTAWPALFRWGRGAAVLALAAPLYALFRPRFEAGVDAGSSSEQGILLHGLYLVRNLIGPAAPLLAECALWANGLAIGAASLQMAWKRGDDEAMRLWCWVAAFAGILIVSDFVGERFYSLLLPVLLLLFYPRLAGRRWAVAAWVGGMACVAGVYAAIKMSGG